MIVGHGEAAGDGGEDSLARPRAAAVVREAASAGELLLRLRPMGGDIEKNIVTKDPVARHVPALGLALAPGRDLAKHGIEARAGAFGFEPPPRLFGVLGIGFGRGQLPHLLVQPAGATGPFDATAELVIGGAQVGDIGQRVVELLIAQRPVRPVGKAHGLVDARLGELRHQGLVTDGIAEAAHHGGDLRVEQRRRHGAAQAVEDLDVLTRRVEDLENLRIGHEAEEGGEIQTFRQRVDDGSVVGPGELHQAELRPVGPDPHELGIDGDVIGFGQALAKPGEGGAIGNDLHGGKLYTKTPVRQSKAAGKFQILLPRPGQRTDPAGSTA